MLQIARDSQWTVTAEGIYFAPLEHLRSLYFYDFSTKKVKEIFHNDRNFQRRNVVFAEWAIPAVLAGG